MCEVSEVKNVLTPSCSTVIFLLKIDDNEAKYYIFQNDTLCRGQV